MNKNEKKRSAAAFISAIVLMVALAMACSDDEEPGKQGKIGDTSFTPKFAITVSRVAVRSSIGSILVEKPSSGAVFAVVPFKFKNISKEPVSTIDTPKVVLISPENVKYDEAVGATASYAADSENNTNTISDVNPGITQKDAAVFEVAKEEWVKGSWKIKVVADENIEMPVR